jgi:hypothetical protein
MTTFHIRRFSANASKVTYQVLRGPNDDDVVGSINIRPGEEEALLASWSRPKQASPVRASAAKSRTAFAAALMRNRQRVDRAAVLRGC